MAAARRYAASLEPFAAGAYVNTLTDEGEPGVRRAYPEEKLARLTALKDRYDPGNVFHLNHNIRRHHRANTPRRAAAARRYWPDRSGCPQPDRSGGSPRTSR